MTFTYIGERSSNELGGAFEGKRFALVDFDGESQKETTIAEWLEVAFRQAGYETFSDCGYILIEVEDKYDFNRLKQIYKEQKPVISKNWECLRSC